MWAFERSVLLPSDPASYRNVILDAAALSDGGWIVLVQDHPRRGLVDPRCYGCGGLFPRWGRLLRLSADGGIVAQEHAAEPLGLQRIHVFEELGVVVGEGMQVRNGTVHALRLDDLDGIASELTNCVPAGGRCWSYRTSRAAGSTALEERDPRDLHVIHTYPQLTMDGLLRPPAIYPSLNLIAWDDPGRRSLRVSALDTARPVAIGWLDRLRSACEIARVQGDRALLMFSDAGCDSDTGWRSELVEMSTGKVLLPSPSLASVSGNVLFEQGQIVLEPEGLLIDPRTAVTVPDLSPGPRGALAVDWDRGAALVPLTNGGAAALGRVQGSSVPSEVSFRVVASGRCADIAFPRLIVGPQRLVCQGMDVLVERGQLAIATGRNYRDPVDLKIVAVRRDDVRREITVSYAATAHANVPMSDSPVKVVELADLAPGEWLVRLDAGADPVRVVDPGLFAIRVPLAGYAPVCPKQEAAQPGGLLPTRPGKVAARVVRDDVWTRPRLVPGEFIEHDHMSPSDVAYQQIVCHPVYAYGYGNAEGTRLIHALGAVPTAFRGAAGNPNYPSSLDNPTPGLGLQLWLMDVHFRGMSADGSGHVTVTLERKPGFELVIFDLEAVALSPHPAGSLEFRFVDATGSEMAPSFVRQVRASWERGRAPAP